MLKAGVASVVKFNVDVHGTGAEPKVRLVFSVFDKELGYRADMIEGKWQATVELPDDTPDGEYGMQVEVTLNNRLFTPLKRRVKVEGKVAETAAPDTEPAVAQAQEQPTTVAAESLLKKFERPRKIVEKVATKVEPEKQAPIPTQAPKPTQPQVPVKPHARIKMMDIANESSKKFDKVLKESGTYKKPVTTTTPFHFNVGTPVQLKRGDIVYE